MAKEMLSLRLLMQWLDNLKEGDPVVVRWTNCHHYWSTEAEVAKINENSVRIRITKAIEGHYPVGQEFPVNLPKGKAILRWSWQNTILPRDLNVITEQVADDVAARYQHR